VVAEDWELLVQQQTSQTSRHQRPCSEPGRRSPDMSNIATDCQKNRYPSFISCPYNWRRLTSQVCAWRNDAHWNCPKQTASTICYKINLSWYPISSKLAIYRCEHYRLVACSLYKKLCTLSVFVEVIWKYNRRPVFLNHSVHSFVVYCSNYSCGYETVIS